MAEKREGNLPARSEVPLNPKLRRRVPMRTFYPGSPAKEGAATVTIGSGEHREGMDIQIRKSASYCAEGILETASGPAALRFSIEAQQPSSGISSRGGMFMAPPGGTTGRDGRFRICDLSPGLYRLTAHASRTNPRDLFPSYATAMVNIVDEDVRDLRISATAGLPLEGEVVWDGAPPEKPIDEKLHLSLRPLLRANFSGEELGTSVEIPGTFSFPGLLVDDYVVHTVLDAPGLYIKDVLYGGRSVRYTAFRPGSAMAGAGLRVVVARDGATLSARVVDKEGSPAGHMNILLLPSEITSEGMLAAAMVTGHCDQLGHYRSRTLAPGKYYVAATGESFDETPESISRLWRSRTRFKEVELQPNGTAEISLEPREFD